MRYLIITVVMFALFAYFPLNAAQDLPREISVSPQPRDSALTDDVRQNIEKGELFIVGKNEGKNKEDFLFKMGERIHIKATGEVAKRVKMELEKTGASRSPILLFDGIKMANLPSAISQLDNGNILRFSFYVDRNPALKESREAWDTLFKSKDEYILSIEATLAVGNELPLVVQSAHPFRLYVAPAAEILSIIGGALLILFASYYLIVNKTNMLKDNDSGRYSLGKSQMAFWGLMVVLALSASGY